MVYSLNYRRPAFVSSTSKSISSEKPSLNQSVSSGSTYGPSGIPEALSFDRIISGGTCPPCTTRDFMNYLFYIEHSAENLQFMLWLRDYIKRFSELPESEKVLAPPITEERLEAETAGPRAAPKKVNPEAVAILKGTDFEAPRVSTIEKINVFDDGASTSDSECLSMTSPSDGDASTLKSSKKTDFKQVAANAYESVDVKLQPFTIQPFREEISRIIATYITDGSPRQLNLASKERAALLRALASTTHPSAFTHVLRTVEWTLRHQAHPNFIRWTICNGNRPRVIFARGLGIGGIMGGIITAVLLTISNASRAWRVMAAIPFLIGIATLFAAWKGMCVVLHGMHHRHLRPWELFADADDVASIYESRNPSFESIGSKNSYEDEPWVAKYEKRNLLRKILDREVWIQEPALRQIQDTIFVQALLSAVVVTAIIVGVFVALPAGRMF